MSKNNGEIWTYFYKRKQKWFDVCKEVKRHPQCWQELRNLHACKSSCSRGTGPTRFCCSDSERRMPASLGQVNEAFPRWGLKPPTSPALLLSFRGATGIMETFYPSSSKRPWIFLKCALKCAFEKCEQHRTLLDISFRFPWHFFILYFPSL